VAVLKMLVHVEACRRSAPAASGGNHRGFGVGPSELTGWLREARRTARRATTAPATTAPSLPSAAVFANSPRLATAAAISRWNCVLVRPT
jgi:hypothetical protein